MFSIDSICNDFFQELSVLRETPDVRERVGDLCERSIRSIPGNSVSDFTAKLRDLLHRISDQLRGEAHGISVDAAISIVAEEHIHFLGVRAEGLEVAVQTVRDYNNGKRYYLHPVDERDSLSNHHTSTPEGVGDLEREFGLSVTAESVKESIDGLHSGTYLTILNWVLHEWKGVEVESPQGLSILLDRGGSERNIFPVLVKFLSETGLRALANRTRRGALLNELWNKTFFTSQKDGRSNPRWKQEFIRQAIHEVRTLNPGEGIILQMSTAEHVVGVEIEKAFAVNGLGLFNIRIGNGGEGAEVDHYQTLMALIKRWLGDQVSEGMVGSQVHSYDYVAEFFLVDDGLWNLIGHVARHSDMENLLFEFQEYMRETPSILQMGSLQKRGSCTFTSFWYLLEYHIREGAPELGDPRQLFIGWIKDKCLVVIEQVLERNRDANEFVLIENNLIVSHLRHLLSFL